MALEQEVKVYQFLLGYGEMLLADVSEADAFKLICDGGVHPAWIMGHLAWVANRIIVLCGGKPTIDIDAWMPIFGGNTKPTEDASVYPAWKDILGAWREGHKNLAEVAPKTDAAILEQTNPNERIRAGLPTNQDFLSFVLTGHESMHLGQLSTWRRVQGRPPLF